MNLLCKQAISLLLIMTSSTLVATAADPVRIMPLGDSLTDNFPGYRGPLFKRLKEAGYAVDFVGTNKSKGAEDYDGDHEGHGGFTIGPGPSVADDWTSGKGNIYVNLEKYLKTDPQYILLLVGVNDYFNIKDKQPDYKPDRDGPARLMALVDRIHELKPETKVLVATLLPVGWDPKFAHKFNEALPELCSTRKNVVLVDMNQEAGFVVGDWSKDNLHPAEAGYQKIADVWFKALTRELPKPAARN